MSQATLITGGLLAAFVLYLAANNRLGVYAGIVGIGGSAGGAPPLPGGNLGVAPAMNAPTSYDPRYQTPMGIPAWMLYPFYQPTMPYTAEGGAGGAP